MLSARTALPRARLRPERHSAPAAAAVVCASGSGGPVARADSASEVARQLSVLRLAWTPMCRETCDRCGASDAADR